MNVVLFAEIIINKGMVIDLKSLARNYCLQQSFHLYEIKPNLLQFFILTCVISNRYISVKVAGYENNDTA